MAEPVSTFEQRGELSGPVVKLNIPRDVHVNFLDGTPIKSAKIEVAKGTGQVFGTNWLSLSLTLADAREVSAGGYKLRDEKLFLNTGEPANQEGSLVKPIFDLIETHLKENPQDLEMLLNGLK